jgi:hypothetical protein
MPSLPIPRRYRAGLAAVDRLTDDDVGVLADRLEASAAEISFEELAAQARDDISADVDLPPLLDAVTSLNTLLPDDGSGAERLAEDVSESDDLGIPPERRPTYAARLNVLMRIPALVIAAHATEVVSQHEKVFHDARILTDVRPVFEHDTSTGVKMAALVASMKVEYHPGGRNAIESVFVSLDRGDLEYLRRIVDRALDKMDVLSELLKERDVPRWTANFHDHGAI